MKMFAALFPALDGPRTNNELTAYRAEDSMSMVTMTMYNPLIPPFPVEVRMLLVCKMSRTTIMRVRRMLSDSEIEKYGRPNQTPPVKFAVW